MRKKAFHLIITTVVLLISLAACGKESDDTPVDDQLVPVALSELETGNFYVKTGDSFYLLPFEDYNFNLEDETTAAGGTTEGIVNTSENRLIDFIYKDMAIPTLYKNDVLVYVSDGSVTPFLWERYKDYGYSIGLSGLEHTASEKITSGAKTLAAISSTMEQAIMSLTIPEGTNITVDKINGTVLTPQFLNDGGVITGMSKDATANIDLYAGTQHLPVTVKADTRFFKAFELYTTDRYSLSPDGYAVLEIPSYLKSGFYLINNAGFVKFLNIDRGVDESGIDLEVPYYYTSSDGNTLTYYEWLKESGSDTAVEAAETQNSKEFPDINAYPERYRITIDSTQENLAVTVAYKYIESAYQADANRTGAFPQVQLVDPTGNLIILSEDKSKTYSSQNSDGYTYLMTAIEGPAAGEWYLLFNHFNYIEKVVGVEISSGNATSYLHNSQDGTISIYYDASILAHDFTITWEEADRAAVIKVTAPDGTVFSRDTTPDSILDDGYGKFVLKVPSLVSGEYRFDIKGDKLGRVWVGCTESAPIYNDIYEESSAAEREEEVKAP